MANEPIELNHHYHDRGIKKYLGFYLSEHTRELHHMDEKHSTYHVGKSMMDFEEILSVINESILKQVPVRIQPNIANSDNGSFSNELLGKIQGYTETTIYIDELPIELSLIRHIELASEVKWYQGLD
ncbi:hypothetical protein BW731_01995 [Vagococcus martis]|uniref:Uncharacterized protein n=1 Tax=Vagococcus martis TaxID=1768210 RepID=A0A1V4DF64_9ENTE|nr:hypothetical protein [Vagococcus martis]OPF87061.1 hypothetical protein BW731_01995 [Vagococcus martis]